MIATTWVQIIKALLLIIGASILAFFVLKNYSFSLNELLSEATVIHESKELILYPGKLISDPISAISLGVALIFGTAGSSSYIDEIFYCPRCQKRQNFCFLCNIIDWLFLYFDICYRFWCNNFSY